MNPPGIAHLPDSWRDAAFDPENLVADTDIGGDENG